jgi:acetylornithine deacetylase/succinyl-diaminopimelate desuccinylase-like protein
LLIREGGTIPIGGMFQRELGLPMVTFGLASGGNIHAPNEYVHEAHIPLAIELAIHCYYHLAETMAR